MYRLILRLLVIATITISLGCSVDNPTTPEISQAPEISQSDQIPAYLAKAKPLANLIGTTNCLFSFDNPPIFWKGTIDFGEKGIYGLYFISYDPPRDYSQASPFYEDFVIYDLEDETEETIYLKGWNKGVVSYANKDPEPVKFRANGKITEAYGPFEEWQDCNVHISGLVYWVAVGLPEKAVGTFRIN